MKKPTKRKGFNFLRSYFDVLNELETDKDRLAFLLSIINKQFLNEDPKDLGFIANLCYESQRHQIETSVKGWERASNDTLSTTPPTTPPTPLQEEEEKGEEEVQEKGKEKEEAFDIFWKIYDKKTNKVKCRKKFLSLSNEKIELIGLHVQNYVDSTPDKQFRKDPTTYLNNECWNDEIIVKTNKPNNGNSTQVIGEVANRLYLEAKAKEEQEEQLKLN